MRRRMSIGALMGLCFMFGVFFVYSCSGGSSGSAATISELEATISALEDRVLSVESRLTPVYDSGWLDISQGEELILDHGLVAHPNDLLVDVKQWTNAAGIPSFISNRYSGTSGTEGVFWRFLGHPDGSLWEQNKIRVYREFFDSQAEKIRVRIWMIDF